MFNSIMNYVKQKKPNVAIIKKMDQYIGFICIVA